MSRLEAIFLVMVLVLFTSSYILYRSYLNQKDLVAQQHAIINMERNMNIHYKDSTHVVIENLELDKKLIAEYYGGVVDSLKKDNIKLKNTKQITNTKIVYKDSIKTEVKEVLVDNDTIKTFSYADKWAAIQGYMKDSTLNLKYSFSDSLSIVSHVQRKFLKKDVLVTEVKSANPNAHISYARSITIKDYKPRKFSIGPQIGYGIVGDKFGIYVGIGVSYDLIRF